MGTHARKLTAVGVMLSVLTGATLEQGRLTPARVVSAEGRR